MPRNQWGAPGQTGDRQEIDQWHRAVRVRGEIQDEAFGKKADYIIKIILKECIRIAFWPLRMIRRKLSYKVVREDSTVATMVTQNESARGEALPHSATL